MSSDEEIYLVEEITGQRKRKGVLEYLVHWQGYSNLHNSWEPASAIAHCTRLIEEFGAKKKSSRSKSRSRSRGRSAGKSKSRSRSRGRQSKPAGKGPIPSPSPPSSPSQPATQSAMSAGLGMKKEEGSPVSLQAPSLLRSRQQGEGVELSQQTLSAAKAEVSLEKASISKGGIFDRRRDSETKPVETVQSTPLERRPIIVATPGTCLAVRRVENDQTPLSKSGVTGSRGGDSAWLWSLVDYATLVVFVLVSVCVLFFSLERWGAAV
ncbi:hypothetical protein ACOMHN_060825 [Nucella lapillus]